MIDARKNQLNTSEHVKNVLAWREYLSTMNDNNFFSIIHIYLGEVKTPYNKQNLIEELSSFLRKEEHKETIKRLLSKNDLLILNAIHFIPNPTQSKIAEFFNSTFSIYEIHDALSNFEERLLIFKKTAVSSSGKQKKVFAINPLLSESLKPFFNINLILPPQSQKNDSKIVEKGTFKFSPLFFASVYSIVNTYPDLCKLDGSFKKKFSQQLNILFPSIIDEQILSLFINAAKNLSLFNQIDGNLYVNKERWKSFVKLSFQEQVLYLTVASVTRFTQSQLLKNTSELLAILKNVPPSGFTKSNLFRLAYLIQEKNNDESQNYSRLSSIISQTENANFSEELSINYIVENAIKFDLLKNIAINAEGEKIYSVANYFFGSEIFNTENEIKPLSIDASFSAFIMDCTNFNAVLNLLDCMEFISFDSILKLELTKKSCMKFFDQNLTPEDLICLLQENSQHQIPQNITFSIKEWFEQYQSARIYYGFVLNVSESKQAIIENNAEIKQHIKKILNPGVYLLDYENTESLNSSIEKSKLDFLEGISSTFSVNTQVLPFKRILANENLNFSTSDDLPKIDKENCINLLEELNNELEKIETTKEQKLGLLERINRKIILSKNQLRPESVRLEKSEAFGMDYSGKIHVIEKAIENHSIIELTYDEKTSPLGVKSLVVKPISLEKNMADTFLTCSINDEDKIETVSVGSAKRVRRLVSKSWDENSF